MGVKKNEYQRSTKKKDFNKKNENFIFCFFILQVNKIALRRNVNLLISGYHDKYF